MQWGRTADAICDFSEKLDYKFALKKKKKKNSKQKNPQTAKKALSGKCWVIWHHSLGTSLKNGKV